ncbi:LuxR C-terminal-related transcriptional regulator [Algoriphagus machipongonensis]|uniref:DNA-binding response regulator, LuxR family n=1 Tax=Algoriphagus machipongonensis TaxID=388413 RepID=A3HTC5_9BACT|nr:LuxR C-terminal-related transcriptional regulator [Algoriphagus machipongonensis]EAZ83093.1 DNA-binding response regulator, LuxR family [Algoriphagus machipongonensis]
MIQPSDIKQFIAKSESNNFCRQNQNPDNLLDIKSYLKKSYHTCLLIDHSTMDFLFAINERGYFKNNPDEIVRLGLNAALELIHPDDLPRQSQIFSDYLKIYNSIPMHERKSFTFCNEFRCRGKDDKYRWLLQSVNFISTNEKGAPTLSFSSYTDITAMKIGDCMNLYVGKYDSLGEYKIRNTCKYPLKNDLRMLSSKEIKILKMISEGMLSKHIAEKLNLSFHTINTHRRNMLKKTKCNTSSEMVNLARNCGVI